ncbi:MAG: hypothetical protein AMXMBFR82_34700 [Candidatus Hydrogenedentota bacterium]
MMNRLFFPMALSLVLACSASGQNAVTPLPHAHAHNDYNHERPLLDALDHGFCSVEADIFLVDGELLVAHDREDVQPERTLQALYLDPLLARVKANGGRVYPDGPEFILLVDIKEDGAATYDVLRGVLSEYAEMLTSFTADSTTKGAVTVILSGDRPIDVVAAETERVVGIDGRVSDLAGEVNPHLMPLISDNWRSHFDWFGTGTMPDDARRKLQEITTKAHTAGCIVRFWGIPPREDLWDALLAGGVDLINTDNLAQLQAFLWSKRGNQEG